MKKTLSTIAFSVGIISSCSATVSLINSVTFSSTPDDPITVDTTLTSFSTVAGSTFSNFSTAASISNISGTEWLWPTNGTDPGSISNAILDLDIASGSLNTGTSAIYEFSTLSLDDTLFAFANYGGDQPITVVAVDNVGDSIGSALSLPNLTITLADTTLERSGGGADLPREIRGISFQVSDFDLGGASVESIAGIRFTGTGFDVNMVGVTTVIPEANQYALLLGGLLFSLILWRRRTS